MHVRRSAPHVEVLAPAKINLFLEVLGRRPDGYHQIETLLAPVAVYDTLTFSPQSDGEIRLTLRWAMGLAARGARLAADRPEAARDLLGEVSAGPDNLVCRAAQLLRDRAGARSGAVIRLVKRIPAAAGLGGASSDAAATLVAANAAWRLGWPLDRLRELGAELGSDVPFFLGGGPAIARGRGERLEPTVVHRMAVIIVRPPIGLSTAKVYSQCRPTRQPAALADLVELLRAGNAAAAGRCLANGLEAAAADLAPAVGALRGEFGRQGLLAHQMSGSGSSYFGICRSAREARRSAARLRGRHVGVVYAAATEVGGGCVRSLDSEEERTLNQPAAAALH
jgi:4-diphosphocytidyl-2-C-methyl-D-erythritol kinase